jgi:hypothetical protein
MLEADFKSASFYLLTRKWDAHFMTLGGDTPVTLLRKMGLSTAGKNVLRLPTKLYKERD